MTKLFFVFSLSLASSFAMAKTVTISEADLYSETFEDVFGNGQCTKGCKIKILAKRASETAAKVQSRSEQVCQALGYLAAVAGTAQTEEQNGLGIVYEVTSGEYLPALAGDQIFTGIQCRY